MELSFISVRNWNGIPREIVTAPFHDTFMTRVSNHYLHPHPYISSKLHVLSCFSLYFFFETPKKCKQHLPEDCEFITEEYLKFFFNMAVKSVFVPCQMI